MKQQPQRQRNLLFVVLAVCLAVIPGCVIGTHTETPRSSVSFVNESDQIVVFAEGATLADAIDPLQNPPSPPLGPEQTKPFSLQVQGEGDTWCTARNRYFWVLGSATNPTEREAFPTPLDIDDIVVLDQIGPGSCWDADSTYAYGG